MTKHSKSDKAEAVERLRKYLKPAACTRDPKNGHRTYTEERQNVYMIVRSVSRSGMSRVISTYVNVDGDLLCLDWAIAVATDSRLDKRAGVHIGGCGMDMCFALLDHAVHAAFGQWVEVKPCRQYPNGRRYSAPDANDFIIRGL